MNTQDFIDRVAEGKASDAKEALKDILSARAFGALDARKEHLASNLFGGQQEEESTAE
jgi:ClpP class serine protease